jgi:hypothetical protein
MKLTNITNSEIIIEKPNPPIIGGTRPRFDFSKINILPKESFDGSSYHLNILPNILVRSVEGFEYQFSSAPSSITVNKRIISNGMIATASDASRFGAPSVVSGHAYSLWGMAKWTHNGNARKQSFSVKGSSESNDQITMVVGDVLDSNGDAVVGAANITTVLLRLNDGIISFTWDNVGNIDSDVIFELQYDYNVIKLYEEKQNKTSQFENAFRTREQAFYAKSITQSANFIEEITPGIPRHFILSFNEEVTSITVIPYENWLINPANPAAVTFGGRQSGTELPVRVVKMTACTPNNATAVVAID